MMLKIPLCTSVALALSLWSTITRAAVPPGSFPHNYTGIPTSDFSPAWQEYFRVQTPLPNVTDPLPRSFAGNIGVNRAGHPNNTLFFWGFERENGSLTARAGERSNEPWLIWLNGGPGSSSFLGFMTENGPLRVEADFSITQNNFTWNKLADAIWVDQPVGTGYSTCDSGGYVADEDQMGEDFLGFLTNLVKVFPSLATRPFFLTGESYAGTYIPYITKTIFSTPNPPVNLRKIAIGDGAIGPIALYEELPVVSVIETYPQIIGFDRDVFNYFREQTHLCGYDVNLTYPQNGIIPTLRNPFPPRTNGSEAEFESEDLALIDETRLTRWSSGYGLLSPLAQRTKVTSKEKKRELENAIDIPKREADRLAWKRDLTGRPNGTLDPFYGCDIYSELLDYALNLSFPWTQGDFDPYDIPDALSPESPDDASVFLNDNRTRSALHAPTSKNWRSSTRYPFGSNTVRGPGTNPFGDPSDSPTAFMTDLATNASAKGVDIIIYSGNDDSLVAHRGTEVVIQNTTFGGIQGFTKKPSTPWFDDDGNFAGIIHQERNLTYVLFKAAGHFVPRSVPQAAFVFLREFVLGSNTTGLFNSTTNTTIGGEDPVLAEDIMPGGNVIYYGHGVTASSTSAPSATIASWNSFIATATATTVGGGAGRLNSGAEGRRGMRISGMVVLIVGLVGGGLVLGF